MKEFEQFFPQIIEKVISDLSERTRENEIAKFLKFKDEIKRIKNNKFPPYPRSPDKFDKIK